MAFFFRAFKKTRRGAAPTSSASVSRPLFLHLHLLQLVDFVADSFHVVKAIEERLAVDAHPREQGLDFLVLVEDEACIDDGLLQEEADGLVVGDTVSEGVDFVKLVEDIRVVVLHLRRGAGFVGEDAEQGAACHAVLHGREHVFPDAELEAGEEFGVGIEVVGEQFVISAVYDVVRLVQDGTGKRAAGHDGILQPLSAHARGQFLVNGIAQGHLEAADDGERLLRQLQVVSVEGHRLARVAATGRKVSVHPLLRHNPLKFAVFHKFLPENYL